MILAFGAGLFSEVDCSLAFLRGILLLFEGEGGDEGDVVSEDDDVERVCSTVFKLRACRASSTALVQQSMWQWALPSPSHWIAEAVSLIRRTSRGAILTVTELCVLRSIIARHGTYAHVSGFGGDGGEGRTTAAAAAAELDAEPPAVVEPSSASRCADACMWCCPCAALAAWLIWLMGLVCEWAPCMRRREPCRRSRGGDPTRDTRGTTSSPMWSSQSAGGEQGGLGVAILLVSVRLRKLLFFCLAEPVGD